MRFENDSLNNKALNHKESADHAYESTAESAYSHDDINVIMSEETLKKYHGKEATLETSVGSKATEGAAIGGALGGTMGAMIGAIAAVGTTLVLPGLGLVIAGPIAAAIAGAGAGGLTAGLVGALIGWGISEDRLKAYEQDTNDGSEFSVIQSKFEDDTQRFESQWKNHNRNQALSWKLKEN